MRFFAVEGGSTRIPPRAAPHGRRVRRRGQLDDPTRHRRDPGDLTEEELLAIEEGRRALELWRRGDDSAHARATLDELAIDALDDELEGRGV